MGADVKIDRIEGVYSVADASVGVVPVVFDSPHSGTAFPADFQSSVASDLLMRAGDLFVDELFAAGPSRGAALLSAHFPRIYLDANRPLDDLDPSMRFEPDCDSRNVNQKTAKGIGLIWTVAPDQSPLYDHPLSQREVRNRIEQYWGPYHAALESLLSARRDEFGGVWHVDCHSMPGTGTRIMGDFGKRRPDFILGDRNGTTCSADFTNLIADCLRNKGFDVRVNERFKGAEIVRRYGDPATECHSIQVEINRSLYMDEQRLERLEAFSEFRDDVIASLIDDVCTYAADQCACGMGRSVS